MKNTGLASIDTMVARNKESKNNHTAWFLFLLGLFLIGSVAQSAAVANLTGRQRQTYSGPNSPMSTSMTW